MKATLVQRRWLNVESRFVKKIRRLMHAAICDYQRLATMPILWRGYRMSITPIDIRGDGKKWAVREKR